MIRVKNKQGLWVGLPAPGDEVQITCHEGDPQHGSAAIATFPADLVTFRLPQSILDDPDTVRLLGGDNGVVVDGASVLLGTEDPGQGKKVALRGHKVESKAGTAPFFLDSDDTAFWLVIAAAATAAGLPMPSGLTAYITGGSNKVKASD
jgi:hypothetical protein